MRLRSTVATANLPEETVLEAFREVFGVEDPSLFQVIFIIKPYAKKTDGRITVQIHSQEFSIELPDEWSHLIRTLMDLPFHYKEALVTLAVQATVAEMIERRNSRR